MNTKKIKMESEPVSLKLINDETVIIPLEGCL